MAESGQPRGPPAYGTLVTNYAIDFDEKWGTWKHRREDSRHWRYPVPCRYCQQLCNGPKDECHSACVAL
jgi:hypothetical protein